MRTYLQILLSEIPSWRLLMNPFLPLIVWHPEKPIADDCFPINAAILQADIDLIQKTIPFDSVIIHGSGYGIYAIDEKFDESLNEVCRAFHNAGANTSFPPKRSLFQTVEAIAAAALPAVKRKHAAWLKAT